MTAIQKIDEFLSRAQTFYLATENGDKPKCRPLGFHMVLDGKLYFAVGDFKEVYKQMLKNPNVEICATVEGDFLRYYGTAVFEKDYSVAEKALEASPFMKEIYNEKTGKKLAVFHLEKAVAEFRAITGAITESYNLD